MQWKRDGERRHTASRFCTGLSNHTKCWLEIELIPEFSWVSWPTHVGKPCSERHSSQSEGVWSWYVPTSWRKLDSFSLAAPRLMQFESLMRGGMRGAPFVGEIYFSLPDPHFSGHMGVTACPQMASSTLQSSTLRLWFRTSDMQHTFWTGGSFT